MLVSFVKSKTKIKTSVFGYVSKKWRVRDYIDRDGHPIQYGHPILVVFQLKQ